MLINVKIYPDEIILLISQDNLSWLSLWLPQPPAKGENDIGETLLAKSYLTSNSFSDVLDEKNVLMKRIYRSACARPTALGLFSSKIS